MINPTGFWRQRRRELREAAGKRGKGGPEALTWAQSMLNPDTMARRGWGGRQRIKFPNRISEAASQHWGTVRTSVVACCL